MDLCMQPPVLDSNFIHKISEEADEILESRNHEKLQSFIRSHFDIEYRFASLLDEAQFFYVLGNCYQVFYNKNNSEWFSNDLSRSVISFRRALYAINQIKFLTDKENYLYSCIETNLGNVLRAQGRVFCCIPLWNSAYKRTQNHVAIISKARHEIFLANCIYDTIQKECHYFNAYKLINLYLTCFCPKLEGIYPETDQKFLEFKKWFENNFNIKEFDNLELFDKKTKKKRMRDYWQWCGDNGLFINDLNDNCAYDICYNDSLGLPGFSFRINNSLSLYEELTYHGNFDELKDDYCYARYLVFSAKNMTNDQKHFFNDTYYHVDDMSHSITNLKAQHYKSAFKNLYAIFDKIAYFMNRFFDLNNIEKDSKININSVFKDFNSRSCWKPNKKIEDSKNIFIHALFYVLKDIRDVQDSDSVSRWLDPDTKSFYEIRNAIEHRSFKIVDNFGYTLTQSDKKIKQYNLIKIKYKKENLKKRLDEVINEISELNNRKNFSTHKLDILKKEKQKIEDKLNIIEKLIYEQKKCSSHSMMITENEFEMKLMTLMKLVRNSIMYLALALHMEEKNKPEHEGAVFSREVPMKSE